MVATRYGAFRGDQVCAAAMQPGAEIRKGDEPEVSAE